MNEPQNDLEHLRLLAIFHYVVGGVAGLFALFPVMHVVMGIWMVSGKFPDSDPSARFMGWFFIAMGAGILLTGLVFAGLIVFAGRNLSAHTRYMFCLVIAAIECAFAPFGTVLGVFTIIVLQRPSVKQLFAASVPLSTPSIN